MRIQPRRAVKATVGTIAGALLALGLLLASAPAAGAAEPVWLCKPGIANNPCQTSLETTELSPSGQVLGVRNVEAAKHSRVDCFYVYPTVSDQKTGNANFNVDPELRSVALFQAARYSQTCRVFAPVYRQLTLTGIFGGANPDPALAYADVLNAWNTYLHKYNHGRGVVLIGHSQGTFVLRQLIKQEIDPNRSERRKLVSAILLGGNATVAAGRDVGGDFQHIRTCHLKNQVGCVIAFSTFNAPVAPTSRFGRAAAGQQVVCTNPARLLGGSAPLKSVFPTVPFAPGTTIGAATGAVGYTIPAVGTPWVETVAYTGRCSSADNANVLQITPLPGAPTLHPVPDTWGLHLVDANIALGNLVDTVRMQGFVYRHRHRFGH